jgi:hypothetical protein
MFFQLLANSLLAATLGPTHCGSCSSLFLSPPVADGLLCNNMSHYLMPVLALKSGYLDAAGLGRYSATVSCSVGLGNEVIGELRRGFADLIMTVRVLRVKSYELR